MDEFAENLGIERLLLEYPVLRAGVLEGVHVNQAGKREDQLEQIAEKQLQQHSLRQID